MLLSFFFVSLLLAVTPGPDNLFVLGQSLRFGPRAGLAITLGLCCGLVGHTALVAFGVAEFLRQSDFALPIIGFGGAGYLLYLAWGSWRAPASSGAQDESSAKLSGLAYFRRGLVMNLSNPKVLLFFLALLPQFVDTRGSVAVQVLVLGAVFMLAAFLVFGAIAMAAGQLRRLMVDGKSQIWMNRIVAGLFVGLAFRLVWWAGVQLTQG